MVNTNPGPIPPVANDPDDFSWTKEDKPTVKRDPAFPDPSPGRPTQAGIGPKGPTGPAS